MAIFLTGVTGILGSEVGLELTAEREDVFYLIRESSVAKAPIWMDPKKAIIGDITLPLCGIRSCDMEKLHNAKIEKVIHMAADVSFAPEDKDGKIRLSNYYGTKNVLNVAKILEVKEFHYCSTCYASTRRNPYEISKDDADRLVRESGIPFSIYKPSAMVGDYETGEVYGFNGFIGAFAVFHWIVSRIREKKPGKVNLPVFAVVSPESTMNIIPVDWVKYTFQKLLKIKAKNEVYHLSHNRPPKAKWAIEQVFKIMEIDGVRYLDRPVPWEVKAEMHENDISTLNYQRRIDPLLDQFIPYCMDEKKFSLFSVRRALGNDFIEPPSIDTAFLNRLIEYATEKNFGLRKKREKVAASAISAAM